MKLIGASWIRWALLVFAASASFGFMQPFGMLRKGTFDPAQFSGLKLWLKADGTLWQDSARTVAVTADGDPVGAWDDASGNGYVLSQSSGVAQPVLKTNVLNGRPVIRFDGGDLLTATSGGILATFRNAAYGMIFAVAKTTNTAQSNRLLVYSRQGGTASRAAIFYRDSTTSWSLESRRLDADATQRVSGTITDTSFHQFSAEFDWANSNAGLYVDGVLDAVETAFFVDGNTSDTDSTGVSLGGQYDNSAANQFTGDVAEILVFNAPLTSVQRQQVEAYLRDKWGTP